MICFDTGPVIWGVQKKPSAGEEHLADRTKRYIRYLSEEKKRIMIPAPVLEEYLIGFNDAEMEEEVRLIESRFFVPSLDLRASVLAAQIEGNQDLIKSIRKTEKISRGELRTDAQIIAIAIVNGAERIKANDRHFEKLAQGRIVVEEVPDIHVPNQPDLPNL